ncbi:MAG: PAS domain S-box protein [Aggregatilineales bacterium]
MINTKITHQSIYLIDPDTDSRNRLANALRELGRVNTSSTVDEFMAQHKHNAGGVVILDDTLPAWESTIKQLKLKPDAPHIILLTPNDNGNVSRALQAGVDDCVTRPVLPELLRRRVGVLLSQASYQSGLNGQVESTESLNEDSHYRDIFMSANDAIMVVDLLSSQFMDVNHKATRLLGYSYDEFKKLTLNDLRDSDAPHLSGSSVYDELTTRGSFIFQQIYITKTGERLPVEVSSRTLRYNGRSATLNFVRDVRMRVEMENAEREQRRLAEALRDNASVINSTLELSDVIDRILEQVMRFIQCNAANIMLIEGDQTRMIGHRGYEKFVPLSDELIHPGWKISEKENIRRVITTRKPFVLSDVSVYGGWIRVPSAAWVNSHLCVPIILDSEVIGLLNLDDSRIGKLHQEYVSSLVAFADQASIAIRNARLYEQVRNHAETMEKRVEERTSALQKINDELLAQIEENQRIAEELTEERTLLRTVIDNIPDDVYVKDLEGRFLLVNESVRQHMKARIPGTKLLGATDFEFAEDEVASQHQAEERAMFESGTPIINQEVIVDAGTPQERVLLISKMLLHDSNGKVRGLVGINRDVTEIRQADRQLAQERTLLRTVIDNIPDDVYVKDVEGRFVLVNKPLQERLKTYLPEGTDLIGTANDRYMTLDRASKRDEVEKRVIETGEAVFNDEIEIILTDGKAHIQLATKVPLRDEDGAIIGMIGINRDITDTHETRRALEKERALLRTLVDNIPDHVYVKDTESRFLLANRAVLDNFSVTTEDEILGKRDSDFLPENLSSAVYEQEQKLMETGEPSLNVTHLSYTHSRWLIINKVPLYDQDGHIIGVIGVNRDVTDMREANEALEKERTMLRTLIDNLPDRIYIKDRESRFLLVNRAVTDRRENEVIGKTDFDLDPDYIARPAYEIEQNLMETGEASINMLHRDHISNDWLLITKIPLKDQNNEVTGLIGINRNVTEVKQAQDQLQQLVDELQGAEQRLQHVVKGAQCLLWYAIVTKIEGGKDQQNLNWQMFVSSEEAAQQFLPVPMESGDDYVSAWQKSILREDYAVVRRYSASVILDGKSGYRHEFRCLRADGEIRWLAEETQITPLTEGRWNVVGICTDVTELKQAEMALRQTNEMLESRVAERTRELMRVNAEERSQRLLAEALSDTSAALSSSLELNDVLDRILSYAATVMPMHDMANILLIEGDDYVRVIRSREYTEDTGRFQTLSENTVFHLSKMPMLQTIVRTGESLTVRNTDNPQPWLPIASNEKPVKSYICAPINSSGKIIGFVSFASTQAYRFSVTDTDRLIAFTNQAGIAISNARLFADVRNQANVLEQMVAERTVELENERSQLRTILNGMTEGVIYYDISNDVRYVNESLVKLTGYTEQEWQSASGAMLSLDLRESERRAVLQSLMSEVSGQGTYHTELQMRTKGNRRFDASVIFSVVHGEGDDIVGHVVVMRDISQEKRLEAQKAHFIANASHELRTPITNLKTRLYLINRQQDRMEEHLDVMRQVTSRMHKLVNDLLDISRFENNMIRLDYSTVAIQSLIANLIHIQQPEADKKSITITQNLPEEPLYIKVDISRIEQVLTNLLINAINYTPNDGNILLKVSRTPENRLEITIQDDGEGITEDLLPNIFKPFIRGKENHEYKGAGLGLSISKEIIDQHGGTISVESNMGEGACFIIVLDLAESDGESETST